MEKKNKSFQVINCMLSCCLYQCAPASHTPQAPNTIVLNNNSSTSNLGNNSSNNNSTNNNSSATHSINHAAKTFKTWFLSLGTVAQKGGISKTKVKLSAPSWFQEFKFEGNKNVIVNASNNHISFGGGGLNGSLHNYVTSIEQQTTWKNLRLPDTNTKPNQVSTGAYAISDIQCGNIYHAVGPMAACTQHISEAKSKVKTLYYNMLIQAKKEGMTCIVLPAISTAIFAGSGPGFTKQQFSDAIYEGMYEGIQQFIDEHPSLPLHIILNNWEPKF